MSVYSGPICIGMTFDWGDLGRCKIIGNPHGIGMAVKFRAPDGRKLQCGEDYWRRMAENIEYRTTSPAVVEDPHD